ncbi:hypothetical protein N7481_011404 [Penicillium waksmanii]|uniref:uncharacterized protein n=1 Tax=Penicillium waksmanii TaxID=69791 RepID=UPI0025476298|nr:uncharacterized protein N7481_011404 [Penicillium waksmanii]KAJ5974194.1 hypothetical protein N7481_011404 [Penicillium waksmanii]
MIPGQESCQVKLGYLAHTHLLPKEIPTPRAQGKVRTHLVHLEHLLLFPLHPHSHWPSVGGAGKWDATPYTIELGLRGMVDRALPASQMLIKFNLPGHLPIWPVQT